MNVVLRMVNFIWLGLGKYCGDKNMMYMNKVNDKLFWLLEGEIFIYIIMLIVYWF